MVASEFVLFAEAWKRRRPSFG